MPEEFFLSFLKKEQIAKDTYAFYFSREKSDFDFIAGQYIRITLPVEPSHLFSIASSPLEKGYIRIITRITGSPFKNALLTLTPNSEVKIFGPIGRFTLQDEEKEYVFLAGGIGITPFVSIIEYAAAKNLTVPITLFTSFSTVEETIFHKEFLEIAKAHPNIKIIHTITQLESAVLWNGEKGRISPELIKKYVSDPLLPLYYIAGPPKMVEAMERIVKAMSVSNDKIKKENFIGY
ncbi:MAG: FAD-dependent oxidoreductase [Candidatus Levybacteria bacterium]|nr:FAD-dependent oxidoreductase [Candidatus Levybacteria bacterium]